MAILLRALYPDDELEAFTCPAGTGLIIIGTLWPGDPARFNGSAQGDLIGIAILAARRMHC
jgi:hypothetical protein